MDEKLEAKIEYRFKNRDLLKTAVTHTSYANEHRKEGCRHNERLEFLGDAVLEAISSEFLFRKYPDKMEGELSKTRASMVCEPSLAKCARDLGLPAYLRLGKGEEQMGGRSKDSIISDAVEAVIGAIYLDGGFEEAKKFVMNHVLLDLHEEDLFKDEKTKLQEVIQDQKEKVTYRLISEVGPDHDKKFTVAAYVGDEEIGVGTGRTKKAAAQAAALMALSAMKKE
ncbi:MAG: ribonuclease III [Lachnospiraceae bacterium]|nr:ribonuclease III [Lachnospiraceae bacterium]